MSEWLICDRCGRRYENLTACECQAQPPAPREAQPAERQLELFTPAELAPTVRRARRIFFD